MVPLLVQSTVQMPAISWDSHEEPHLSETLSLGALSPSGWGGEGNSVRSSATSGNLAHETTGAVYSTRSGAFFGREAAVPGQVNARMENGHVAAGAPQPSAGQGAAPMHNEEPAMIPFLSACFAELRAKGLTSAYVPGTVSRCEGFPVSYVDDSTKLPNT